MTVSILGVEYTVAYVNYDDDEYFKANDAGSYCDFYMKQLVVCMPETLPCNASDKDNKISMGKVRKESLRHEIVHAFLYESGLNECSHCTTVGWARNEEMIDFVAIQGPKIYKVWQDAEAI